MKEKLFREELESKANTSTETDGDGNGGQWSAAVEGKEHGTGSNAPSNVWLDVAKVLQF